MWSVQKVNTKLGNPLTSKIVRMLCYGLVFTLCSIGGQHNELETLSNDRKEKKWLIDLHR